MTASAGFLKTRGSPRVFAFRGGSVPPLFALAWRVGPRLFPPTMRIVIQRVSRASVSVAGRVTGEIGPGLLLLLGVEPADTPTHAERLAAKVAALRIFEDEQGRMNLALTDTGAEALVVSQFTLYGNARKGNRPSFNRAAAPGHAEPLYRAFVDALARTLGRPVPTGEFGAMMAVSLVNDGPVTLVMDTELPDV